MQIWLSFCAYFYGRKWWLSSQLAYRCQFFIGFVNLRSDISNLADDYNTQMLIVDINKNEYNSNAYESHKINTSISQRYQNKCNNKIFSIQTFMREQKTCKNIPKTWPAFFFSRILSYLWSKIKSVQNVWFNFSVSRLNHQTKEASPSFGRIRRLLAMIFAPIGPIIAMFDMENVPVPMISHCDAMTFRHSKHLVRIKRRLRS